MSRKPGKHAVAAWIALTRAHQRAVSEVERRLKEAGFPPLAWYDALWELERAGKQGLRPFELERRMLFEQYNLSRLVDRLVKAGLVERAPCPGDRRGQMLLITVAGRELRRRMWPTYAAAIEAAVGDRISDNEAEALAASLGKLLMREPLRRPRASARALPAPERRGGRWPPEPR